MPNLTALPPLQPAAPPKETPFDASRALAIASEVLTQKEEEKSEQLAQEEAAKPKAPPTPEPVVLLQGPSAVLSPTLEEGDEEEEEEESSSSSGDEGEELLLMMEGDEGASAAAAAPSPQPVAAPTPAPASAEMLLPRSPEPEPAAPADRTQEAAAEWDMVMEQREKTAAAQQVQLTQAGVDLNKGGVRPKLGGWGNPITFLEAGQRFEAAIAALPESELPPRIPVGGGGLFACCLGGGGAQAEEMERQVQLVVATAKTKYEAADPESPDFVPPSQRSDDDPVVWHERVLQTVYMRLTGTKEYCVSQGAHWQDIGFQGHSPLTDLRGVGMLGLHHLLWVCTVHCEKARRILLDVDQSCYGFCATSMSFSLMALNALRSGHLNAELRRRIGQPQRSGAATPAVAVVAELYGALVHRHYRMWRGGRKQRKDIGFVMRDIDLECGSAKGVRTLLRDYGMGQWGEKNLEAQIAAGGGENNAPAGFADGGGLQNMEQ